MAKTYENETYIEWYTRKLGSVHAYPEMTDKRLGRKMKELRRDLGATLIYLRRDPESESANMVLNLIEPHYKAAVQEARGRGKVKAA